MKKICVLFLSLILCGFFAGCNITEYTYGNSEKYLEYSEFVKQNGSETSFEKLNIDWIAGNVSIKEGDAFEIVEHSDKENYPPMYCLLENGVLTVKFCKSGTSHLRLNNLKKTLEIIVTSVKHVSLDVVSSDYAIELSDLDGVEVDGVSGNGRVALGNVQTANFDLISGSVDLSASECEKIEIDAVSGLATVRLASVKTVAFDTVSGDLDLTVEDSSALQKIDFDSTDGNLTVKLDGAKGFDLSFDTVSGSKDLAFTEGSSGDEEKFKIDFDSVSGNLTVSKR